MITDKVRCKCCNGLCPWHSEHGPRAEDKPEFQLICNCGELELGADWTGHYNHKETCPAKDGRFEPPGCWSCCGSGCRACGNTGFISKEKAMKGLLQVIDSKGAKITELQKEVAAHRKEYYELLNNE